MSDNNSEQSEITAVIRLHQGINDFLIFKPSEIDTRIVTHEGVEQNGCCQLCFTKRFGNPDLVECFASRPMPVMPITEDIYFFFDAIVNWMIERPGGD